MAASKFSVKDLNLYYGDFHALKDINLELTNKEITAFIGPSGCGKSTFLKSLNRMNDLVEGCKITGDVHLDGEDIYNGMDVSHLRKRVGMVFQKPNPFPMSVYDNIAYGPRTHGIHSRAKLDEIVETSLKNAAIWDEVKDRLKKRALGLSGGQHVVHCRDTIGKDSVRPGMTRGTFLRRRPYMKPLSSLLEQAPPSLVLDLMDTCRLETRHRDFLWRQGPQEIRQALLDCDGFLIGLTESQARDILTTGNVPLLCRLATLLPGRAQSPYRLSRATHEKLWRHLRGHPDMRIREALAGNDALPPAFAISFADRIRQHLPFCRTTFRDLRQEDVGLLLQGPYQRLVEALPFMPCIRDGKVRRTFIQGVLDHKDPVVRLELSGMARHRSHPLRPYGPMLFSDVPPDGSAARQDIFAMPVWSEHAVKGGASLRLATSGQHLPLTYRQLAALAASLAPCQREVTDALLALEIPSLTETIIATACLSCEQMDSLWSSGGLEVRRTLLGQQHFIQHLDAGQVRDILKADDRNEI